MHRDELDWGCPDWRNPEAYGDVTTWDVLQWRWEFKRRTQGIRFIFQDLSHKDWRKWNPSIQIPLKLMWSEEYREKIFYLTPKDAAYFGFSAIPNPLYTGSFQKLRQNNPRAIDSLRARTLTEWHLANADVEMFGKSALLGSGQIAIVFDPNQAIEPQLEGLREYLLERTYHRIKPLQRSHPKKWLRYIRILDAREQGASWSQCAEVLLSKNTAATPQTASDTFKHAERMRDRL